MVNVNIEIPEDLHKQVKLAAVVNDRTIRDEIIERIQAGLGRRRQ